MEDYVHSTDENINESLNNIDQTSTIVINNENEDILASTDGLNLTVIQSGNPANDQPVTPPNNLPETGIFGSTQSVLLLGGIFLLTAFLALIRNLLPHDTQSK